MRIAGSRVLVAGATGELGAALAVRLAGGGARVAVAGRDQGRLREVAQSCGAAARLGVDAYDLDGCARLASRAHEHLGGLDAVVTTIGVAAFGRAHLISEATAEHVMTVNALAPIAVLRGALPLMGAEGTLAAVTGVVAAHPQPGMADYSAAKAALRAWLVAVSAETRDGVRLVELALPHLDTGFAHRSVVGSPPPLPRPMSLATAVATVVGTLEESG